MRLALYQPEIPQNMGAAIRASACFGAGLDIIEPCGFPLDSRKIARVAMDYGSLADPVAHSGWSAFHQQLGPDRLVLLTTKAEKSIWSFSFQESDVILMGQESAGAPAEVHEAAFARLCIPLAVGARSLNITTAAAVALAEVRRQIGWG